jgi:hypothetical protein
MKCGARVALGVAGGYFLGRTKKMKLALMLGTLAAGRRAGGPGELLGQATKLLSASPELTRLTDEVKGRLFDAGKGAALAVAARQVEALTDRVGKRVESIGDTSRGSVKRGRKARPEPEREEDYDEEYDEDQYDEPEDSQQNSDTGSDTDGAAEVDAVDAADEDEEDRPSPRQSTRQSRSSAAGRSGKATSDGARRTPAKAAAGARSGRPSRSRRSNDA